MPRNGCEANGGVANDGCAYPDELIMEQGVSFNVRVSIKLHVEPLYIWAVETARRCLFLSPLCWAHNHNSQRHPVDKQPLVEEHELQRIAAFALCISCFLCDAASAFVRAFWIVYSEFNARYLPSICWGCWCCRCSACLYFPTTAILFIFSRVTSFFHSTTFAALLPLLPLAS